MAPQITSGERLPEIAIDGALQKNQKLQTARNLNLLKFWQQLHKL